MERRLSGFYLDLFVNDTHEPVHPFFSTLNADRRQISWLNAGTENAGEGGGRGGRLFDPQPS